MSFRIHAPALPPFRADTCPHSYLYFVAWPSNMGASSFSALSLNSAIRPRFTYVSTFATPQLRDQLFPVCVRVCARARACTRTIPHYIFVVQLLQRLYCTASFPCDASWVWTCFDVSETSDGETRIWLTVGIYICHDAWFLASCMTSVYVMTVRHWILVLFLSENSRRTIVTLIL